MTVVGRRQQKNRIKDLCATVAGGIGAVGAFVGAAGIGKSALLRWAAACAGEYGLAVIQTRGLESADAMPFALLSEIAAECVEILTEADGDGRSHLERDSVGTALVLPEYASSEALGRVARLSFTAQQRAARTAVLRLLKAAAAVSPLMCIADDLHRGDEYSVLALTELLAQLERLPIVLLAGLRPTRDSTPACVLSFKSEVASRGGLDVIGPLSAEEIDELVRSIDESSVERVSAIAAYSGGHPLVVRWLLSGASDVDSFVDAQLSGLREPEIRLVRALCVYGAPFDDRFAGALARELGTTTSEHTVQHLLDRMLLQTTSPGTIEVFHDLVRTSVVNRLTEQNRCRLSGAVGRVLSRGGYLHRAFHDATVARFLVCSDEPADILAGVQYGLRAGRIGLRQSAFQETISLYRLLRERAVDHIDEITLADIEFGLGRAILSSPPEYPVYYEGAELCRRARAVFLQHRAVERIVDPDTDAFSEDPDPQTGIEALSIVPEDHPLRGLAEARCSHHLFHIRPLREYLLESSRTRIRGGPYEWLDPSLLAEQADCSYREGRIAEARQQVERALEGGLLRDGGMFGVRGRMIHANVLRALGLVGAAEERLRQARHLADQARGIPSGPRELLQAHILRTELDKASWKALFTEPFSEEAYPLRPVIVGLYLTGQLEEGDRQLAKLAPGIANDVDAGPWVALVSALALAVRLRCTGTTERLDDALAWLQHARTLFEAMGDQLEKQLPRMARTISDKAPTTLSPRSQSFFKTRIAIGAALLGFVSGDRRMMNRAGEELESLPPGTVSRHRELRALALCLWGTGSPSKALGLLEKAHEYCVHYHDIPTTAWNYADRAAVHHVLGNVIESDRCTERSLSLARKHGMTPLIQRLSEIGGRRTRIESLSRRQREVLDLVSRGLADKEIAAELNISIHTASNHVRHILSRLECANRAEAAALALRGEG